MKKISFESFITGFRHGVYVFVIGGDATINGVELNERDGLGITETDQLNIVANTHTEILLIEVPMNVNVE